MSGRELTPEVSGVERPRVAVLGASGFIGSAVTKELAGSFRVRAVARRPVPLPENCGGDVEVVTADLLDQVQLAEAVADVDAVVSLVSYVAGAASWRVADGDATAERVNVGLVRDLVEAIRRGGKPRTTVVFAGSISQVGRTDAVRLTGAEPDRPEGTYDRQKHEAEQLLKAATADGVLRGIVLRLPTVYGPAAASTATDRGVVSSMVRRALAGEPLTMWHDGTVRRDLLYVDDVARACVAAVSDPEALAGRHWLLGTGQGAPLGDLFGSIAEVVSKATGSDPVPVRSVQPPEHAEGSDFRSVEVDASPFRSATGWRPETPLYEGLTRTVAALADVTAGSTR